MIVGFADKETFKLFKGERVKKCPPEIRHKVYDKLQSIHLAGTIFDLQNPPSNHLELLSGDRKGQHSIRVNRQWRLCFYWNDGNPDEVELVDYHS